MSRDLEWSEWNLRDRMTPKINDSPVFIRYRYYNEISLNELFERAERINSAIRKYLKINKLMK